MRGERAARAVDHNDVVLPPVVARELGEAPGPRPLPKTGKKPNGKCCLNEKRYAQESRYISAYFEYLFSNYLKIYAKNIQKTGFIQIL